MLDTTDEDDPLWLYVDIPETPSDLDLVKQHAQAAAVAPQGGRL